MKKLPAHYAFIMPSVVLLVLIVIFPTVFLYYISMTNYDMTVGWGAKHFVWFENFMYLFLKDPLFWKSLGLTLVFVSVSVSCELVIGMVVALGLSRLNRGKRILVSLIIIPMVCTPSIISLMWKLILNTEYGVANYLLSLLALGKVNWLGTGTALASVILVDIWEWTPFMVLMLYAALQALPEEPFEAAVVDGAKKIQIFFYITLPMMMKLALIALTLRLIDAFKVFDTVYGLTQGGPGSATELFSMRIYRTGFQHSNWTGRASAFAIIMLLIMSPLFLRVTRLLRDR